MTGINQQGGSGSSFAIEGMDELIRKIKALPDRTKRLEVLKILRRQMNPIKKAVRDNTPIATRSSSRSVKSVGGQPKRYKYEPENLKKSIGIFTGKSRLMPAVYVGPAMGAKRKYDGYYGFFVIYGTKFMKGDDFVRKAAAPLIQNVTKVMTTDLKKYIDKRIKQL
tara:strand:- start:4113 stop:4610 length:498 start_codon:yes stop_codon:yes gene_type:complete